MMLRWWKTRGTTPAALTPLTTATPRTTASKSSAAAGATPERSFPTVKFDTSRLTTTVSADLRSNIAAVGDIEARHQEVIYEVALRAIMAGGDLALLSSELRLATDMAARRAGEVSKSLVMKATTLMDVEQRVALGFTKSIWRYAGAPCGTVEQDAAHAAVDGEVYETAKGLFILGKWTWPGYEDGCKCFSRSVTPWG
jgi:uncharacterized protein with gpF-like domain